MSTELLKEGDLIELKDGMEVYADVPKHFVFSNKRGCFDLTHSAVTIGGEFDYLAGEYVVIKTAMTGGGTGHGPNDVFTDGHRVWCQKTSDSNVNVDFYQTGCFTAMIRDIKPIGQAKLVWRKEP